jgi:anthranilate phosphoribosyltransferase
MSMQTFTGQLLAGQDLSMAEMEAAIDELVSGIVEPAAMGAFLMALRTKGETGTEIAGAARALRRRMTPIVATRSGIIDTCGTGGDGSQTFNISTAAALVAAAAGVPVAKHGNRGITSRTGSADALAALGVNIEASVTQVERCLNELGICFCFAPLAHPSMKKVAEVRKSLGVPTIFNLLGPLANPAQAPYQLLGVGKAEFQPLLAEALQLLDTQRSAVVRGDDGLDEVSLQGPTRVLLVEGDTIRKLQWQPADFGLAAADRQSMLVTSPAESAEIIRQVLAGKTGPPRDIVVLNAAAALWVAGIDTDLCCCAQRASMAIDSGDAARLLARLADLSRA